MTTLFSHHKTTPRATDGAVVCRQLTDLVKEFSGMVAQVALEQHSLGHRIESVADSGPRVGGQL